MDIFDMLDEKFDLYNQVNDLNIMLFDEKSFYANCEKFSFVQVFNHILFRSWKYSKGRSSIYKLVEDLNLDEKHDIETIIKQVSTELDVYKSLQLDFNILTHGERYIKSLTNTYILTNNMFFQEVANKISYIFDKAGIKSIKHPSEEYYLIVPQDEKVKAVAENTDKDTAFLIYEYTSPLIKGNFKEKRRILKLLANKYESLIKFYNDKYKNGPISGLIGDLSFILNNYELRHPNLDPLVPQYYKEVLTRYSSSQWLEIYDTAYQLILALSMIDEYNNELSKIVVKHKELL